MQKYFARDDGYCQQRRRRALRFGCALVLLVTSATITTACGADHPTSPSALSARPGSIGGTSGDTSSSAAGGTSSPDASATSVAQATTVLSPPANFRLERRDGSVLRLNWDWPTSGGLHYDLSYAGRTIVLNHDYPGHTQDVSDLDLSPGHTYTFALRLIDGTGHASSPAQLPFETTPPESPSNLRQLSTRRVTYNDGHFDDYPDLVSFTAARDEAGPTRSYEVFVDGRSFGSIGLPNGQFSVFQHVADSYTNFPCGSVPVQLRAYDSSLNQSRLSAALTVMFPPYDNCPSSH